MVILYIQQLGFSYEFKNSGKIYLLLLTNTGKKYYNIRCHCVWAYCRSNRNASDNTTKGGASYAQNLSAQEAPASEGARLQKENEDEGRQSRTEEKTR